MPRFFDCVMFRSTLKAGRSSDVLQEELSVVVKGEILPDTCLEYTYYVVKVMHDSFIEVKDKLLRTTGLLFYRNRQQNRQ